MSSVEYYRLALIQYILYQHQMAESMKLQTEIQHLKSQISQRHKKHRRCDRDIQKQIKCAHCEKFYASQVALKLHCKLKHKNEDKLSTSGAEDSRGLGDSSLKEVIIGEKEMKEGKKFDTRLFNQE